MIEEGTVLQERYRIEKPIGQGGMGAVFLATDKRFGSKVAIKETLFSDEHYLKAFKREARLLNSLKHSALPKVSDHFVENNGQYIVMEYIGGEDLFDEMEKKSTAFSYQDVLNWTHQLLDALEYLHNQANPVIHRDIKPQNLKLTSDGRIILLDFGLAKGNPTDANHKTAANSIFGYSRNYASLEQIQGTGTDPRSDIYSLGSTMYHLVTGSPPSDALTRVMLVLNEEKDPLRRAHKIFEKIPVGFSELLHRAMSLNAKVRPQSTVEMRELLAEIEETGVLGAPSAPIEKGSVAPFVSPKTGTAKSEMKTEVLAPITGGQDSIATKIVKPDTTVGIKRNTDGGIVPPPTTLPARGRRMVTAILAGGVLVGSIVGGVYFVKPELFESSPSVIQNVESKPIKSKSTKKSKELEIADTNVMNLNDNSDSSETQLSANTATIASAPPKRKKPKPIKKTKKPQKKPKLADSRTELTITQGNVIVNDKKIEIKQGKMPQWLRPLLTRKEFNKLTPAQKRKFRVYMKNKGRLDRRRRSNPRRRPPPVPRKPGQ